jgi:hypothetical protein
MSFSRKENMLLLWLAWHFYQAPLFLLEVWKNYLIFVFNFFSIQTLLKSFLSPWRRYQWFYPKTFDITGYASVFISNIFSRFMGALLRCMLVMAGICFGIITLIAGSLVIAAWILMPLFIILLLFFSFL